jgi:anti-sigma factor RsiW
MTHCPESHRAQDYLDGELVPAEHGAFEAHLAGCAICEREVAVYRRVFARVTSLETWEPGEGFAERVLAEALPQHSRRWAPVLAWGAAASVAVSMGAIAAAVMLPGPRAWTTGLFADATRSLAASCVFLLKSLNGGVLRVLEGFGASGALLARLGSLARVLAMSASQPAVAFTLWAALLAGVALLWWMRPREDRSVREDHHVGMLGL